MGNLGRGLLLAIRPPTLLVGISPVLLGSVYGYLEMSRQGHAGPWQALMFVLALLLVIAMQSAANLVNDVKDAESGIDDHKTRSGPVRVVAAGILSASTVRRSYHVLFAFVLLCCFALVAYGGWSVVLLGALCCLFAYLYTGGPWPLSHLGLGEFVALLFFGPVAVAGSAYLQTRTWVLEPWILGLGPGFIAATVMAINNYRDRQGDQAAGKKTLATRLSESGARLLPWLFVHVSLLIFLFYASMRSSSFALGMSLFILVTLTAYLMIRPLLIPDAGKLNLALKKTTIWEFLYAIAMIGAIWL
ncbi:MAG: 1,4-dihydroxy-2-naphthoate octaprenyltransferase [Oligoflexus sp.]